MSNKRWFLSLGVLLLVVVASPAWAQTVPITAGPNMGSTQDPVHITVPWDDTQDHWQIDEDLIFDPNAPPMEKWFLTPPTLPENSYPPGTAFPVWENFFIVPGASQPVLDWHEEIHTPGWEWRWNDDGSGLPTVQDPLITRDGLPWPWKH